MTVGLHLKANNQAETFSEPLKASIKKVISSNKSLRIEATFSPEQAKRANELLFKTFNIEHTGHNIAGK